MITKDSVSQHYQQEINRTMNTLATRARTENDAYALAIVTYALAKFGHRDADAINQRLLTKAKGLTGNHCSGYVSFIKNY